MLPGALPGIALSDNTGSAKPLARPHYRLRVQVLTAYRPAPVLCWQVQHVAGCRKDHLAYATSWHVSDSAAAVDAAASIPLPLVTAPR